MGGGRLRRGHATLTPDRRDAIETDIDLVLAVVGLRGVLVQAPAGGEVKLGYGFSAFADRFTATPELGLGLSDSERDYRLGWRLELA